MEVVVVVNQRSNGGGAVVKGRSVGVCATLLLPEMDPANGNRMHHMVLTYDVHTNILGGVDSC